MGGALVRRCSAPGCHRRVASGRCDEHRREDWRADVKKRGSRSARGYTARWYQYRTFYLQQHPLCVECEKEGRLTPAKVVDHIIPIAGGGDVLFWPEWNHQALCQTHHNRKIIHIDPVTKTRRKAGAYREEEERAAHRCDWIYEGD